MKIEKYFDRKARLNLWRFDITIAGKRIRRGGFHKKSDAEAALAALRILAERQRYGLPTGRPGYTLADLLRRIEEDTTVHTNRTLVFRQFVEFAGRTLPIVDLRRAHVADFLAHLRERELLPSTQGLYLDHISSFLYQAGRYFSALDDYRPPQFPPRPRGLARQRTLTKDELSKLFTTMARPQLPYEQPHTSAIRLRLLDMARLMLLTGARREELMQLTLDRINYEWRTLNLKSTKVDREHTIALSDLASEILKTRIAQTPIGQGLFEGVDSVRVSRIFARVARETDLNYGQQKNGGWSLHDFRRTAATVIENAGIPYSAVMAQLGHARRDMTARYTPPQMETLRRAAEVLANWCRDIDGIIGNSGDLQRLQRQN